jgi:chromosomal replication initiation ATPase DnaA
VATRDARYDSAKLLAQISGASLQVCELVFNAAGEDALMIRLIRSDGRSDRICRMRHAIAYVAKERLGANFRTIGRALNRDHSTAIHSHRVGAALYARDMEFRDFCERIAS